MSTSVAHVLMEASKEDTEWVPRQQWYSDPVTRIAMEVSEAEEIWIRYSYLTGPCISMREDITKSINQHLGSLLHPIIASPIVTHFTSP